MADTQIHTCSDCAVLSCKAKDEAHYPVAALYTANGMYSRFKNILQR